jgi:hypothetical protein
MAEVLSKRLLHLSFSISPSPLLLFLLQKGIFHKNQKPNSQKIALAISSM